ncbi:TetR/AcrR family transcriptional regulator [Anaerosacchariphilus polymeriproducens]|uniref:TetR/AcrR family transcriptional regulator n=1 Tax=Anaerosacchariphilus polymeriproducens TaxID=1812858 RepID=A0A371AVT6_9FIRM|nr:TetR/AcrR family transcriptional regulator [Anaerosacchariphilus polymeriproducens]RDU23686.1 TetR/AcrR family transcriptional regulator [Anaerosacchariphilus polymeriproducens]
MRDNLLHRKDRLIITTIEIIDELGIQGLSTREIAKRQGVSEATLFRHYKSKNELLIAVLEYFSQFDKDIYYSTKLKKLNPKKAIYYLIRATVEYYENYPAITSIMQLTDVLRYDIALSDKVNEIYENRMEIIKQLIIDAQLCGEIRSDANSEYLSVLIIGLMREICLKWRLEDRNFSLKDRTISTLDMLIDVFST